MTKVETLRGINHGISQRLGNLHIQTISQLLYHWPSRYEDFSTVQTIASCTVGETVTIAGQITKIHNRTSWKRRRLTITEAVISDDTGKIKATWFNQPYLAQNLHSGDAVYLSGKITENKYGRHFASPVYEKYKADPTHTARIVPRYATTAGVSQRQLRYFIKQALELHKTPDWLPNNVIAEQELLPLAEAIQKIHFPNSWDDVTVAKHRLSFDELLLAQLFVRSTTAALRQERAYAIPTAANQLKQFVQQLPWPLTNAQRLAAWDIMRDLTATRPMNRLLEGDVGAGKTVIAMLAMYNTVLAGYQAVLMAPTELLAEQHYNTMAGLLAHTTVNIGLMTGHKKITANQTALAADILIGTHALIQKNVVFHKLGLAIIDEQHRFGVAQRRQLKDQAKPTGYTPHLLSMTATPIPRSLALTLYGDLELSIVDEFPKGRKPIITRLVTTTSQRNQLYQFISERISVGEQIYIVTPTIGLTDDAVEDEQADDAAVTSVTNEYKKIVQLFPQARVGQLHGQMNSADKQSIMTAFRDGEIDIMIATTVIEVGVDVPNATVMVIESADSFGLAQLHQLRGRVGRSTLASYCYVCCADTTTAALARVQFFTSTNDGFTLADYDLQRRGPGAVYGEHQSGFLNQFKLATLADHQLLQQVKQVADDLFKNLKKYPTVQVRLTQFTNQIHLE
ncbi:MAG: ATP-dependent DNA helicase RecG [Candidatus Kerfeldbacteria bacterium]|nr:ATP-dependent DNA helicase RecG [Candidatus Kerfeldbacteria bacterium]